MNSVIEHIDSIKPNVYSEDDKYRWIARVDGMISAEVHQDEKPITYNIPGDADKELLVPAPYDDIYELFVSAQIDFFNREYDNYNNCVIAFSERLSQYKNWYIQRHPVGKALNFRNVR
jgi:hypothetical protein